MKHWILAVFCSLLVAGMAFAEAPGLSVGTMAPDFTEQTSDGSEFTLSDIYQDHAVVLIFYRGGWCPYCNVQLQEYQQNIEDFEAAGAKIIAISVDSKDTVTEYVSEQQLDFRVVGNPQADLLKLYNLVTYVPQDMSKMYKEKYKIDLVGASGRRDGLIAIPATYVIGPGGEITFAEANEDYKVRPKARDVLEAVKQSTGAPALPQ